MKNDLYLEKKKVDSILYSYDIEDLLKLSDYDKIDLEKFKKAMIAKAKCQTVDYEMKNNIYTLLQNERYNKENPDIEKINDIIRITNSANDENIDSYLYKEYLKRFDKKVNDKNRLSQFYNYLDAKDIVRASISQDYYYLNSIVNNDYDDYFKKEIVPDKLVNILFIYTINAALKDNPNMFNVLDKEKILFILKQSKKLMNHFNCDYELDEDDYINLDLRFKTNKLCRKIK